MIQLINKTDLNTSLPISIIVNSNRSNILNLEKKPNYLKLDFNNSLYINDKQIFVEDWSLTILQFSEFLDITIPRFCYHDKLSIAGNCRMCMVELKSSFKPVIACATSLMKKMQIYVNSFFVKQARENVMEFLLINHPLDCPICDQGSECDLQDQALAFGSDRGRFREIKRSVQDLFMGPVIKTIMTRCIHCTRCVRFSEEVVGNYMLGTLGRGKMTEIGSYYKTAFLDELSGNVVDLCPVGASTSKSYAFKARAWELKSIESIDIFDSLGSNIRVDVKGNEVMRILPKRNDYLNEEWISDKIRFSYEGLKKNRLIYPMLRKQKNEPLVIASYTFFFSELIKVISFKKKNQFYVELSNYFSSAADFFIINNFFSNLGINNILFNSLIENFNIDFRSNYLLNNNLNNFENGNNYFLNNINLKKENPVLNSRIKKLKINSGNKIKITYVGSNINLNYDFYHISNNSSTLFKILEGKNFYSYNIYLSKNKHFISGINSINNGINISNINFLKNVSINFSTILPSSSLTTLFELGYNNIYNNSFNKKDINNSILYLYNVENVKKCYYNNNIIIYHGTNINVELEKISNYLLPASSFLENKLFFSNLLGYSQYTNIAISTIPNQLFNIADLYLNLNNEFFKLLSKNLKINNKLFNLIKSSIRSNNLLNSFYRDIYPYYKVNSYFQSYKFDQYIYTNNYYNYSFSSEFINDYYKMDNVSLNSETLQKTSILVNNMKSNFFKNLKAYEYIL
jgi:NADH dehydrogenase (ubiquinone) Fe-S protein 1